MTRVYLEMPGIVLGEVEDDDVGAMHRSGSRAKSEANCRLIAQTPFEARSVLASRPVFADWLASDFRVTVAVQVAFPKSLALEVRFGHTCHCAFRTTKCLTESISKNK
jgi:hypothetical protein